MAYKSGNPALNNDTFSGLARAEGRDAMTLDGVATRSLALLVLCVGVGILGWRMAAAGSPLVGPLVIAGVIAGLVIALITVFKKTAAPVTAPLYAAVQGFVLGAISQLYAARYEGIVLQALLLTGDIFVSMLLIYRARLIRPTQNFKLGLAAATGGIFLFYLANFILGFFNINLPLINSTSNFGILFTIFVVIIAALNLVVDFDFIEHGVEARAPKYMEWYASFGLFVTLVWLYLEILRLLAKLRSR